MSDETHDKIETDLEDSSPNAAGPRRAEGDMGVSSERSGADLSGIEGTGSTGDSVRASTGRVDTRPGSGGPATPDPAQRPRRDGVDEDPEPHPDNDVRPHDSDPARNPGHSHG